MRRMCTRMIIACTPRAQAVLQGATRAVYHAGPHHLHAHGRLGLHQLSSHLPAATRHVFQVFFDVGWLSPVHTLWHSAADKGEMAAMVYNWPGARVDAIVVTDGSRILGMCRWFLFKVYVQVFFVQVFFVQVFFVLLCRCFVEGLSTR